MSEVVRPGGAQVCGPNQTDKLGLRTGAIFVVLITSLVGTLFPIVAKRNRRLRAIIPGAIFEFGKFFGSGVILATALIHLLDPAMQLLGDTNTIAYGGCISNAWSAYPYALGLATSSLFLTFVGELYAYRIGTAYLAKRNISPKRVGGIRADDQSHAPLSEALNDDPADPPLREDRVALGDVSRADAVLPTKDDGSQWSVEEQQWKDSSEQNPASAQLLGVAILEFGILFHSLIIGMTLSLSEPKEYTTLFIVLIFHQMFEGLGLGTRLAFLQLPKSWNWVPTASGVAYSVIAPLGMAIGLGTRETVSMTSGTASVVSGILDSISAGILLYSATVELMAHEFIFTPHYHTCSWKRVNLVLFYFALGAGLMAVLGKWL